jgi:hypothetical protein
VKLVNNCGIDLNNCTARISTNSPQVECIIDGFINIPQIPFEESGASMTPSEVFIWKASSLNQSSASNPDNWEFTVTLVCDEIDATTDPQFVSGAYDLNITFNPNDLTTWGEDFEQSSLAASKFQADNQDSGIPGNSDSEGLINGDDWRCQYSDPDWPNSNSYGTTEAQDCYPAFDLAQSQAAFWQIDTGLDSPTGSGKGFTNQQAMYYGLWQAAFSQYSSPIGVVESASTGQPINLGPDNPILSFWHQVSVVDSRSSGASPGENADRGQVSVQLANEMTGAPVGDWVKIAAFQNGYDTQAGDNFFNCMFDPIDDGNQEDDFFDPTDPNRGINGQLGGPSSTCFPEFTYSCIGDTTMVTSGDVTTDLPFSIANACNADTVNTSTVQAGDNPIRGGNPISTWVQSRYDLTQYRGRRVRLRYLVSSIKVSNPDWRAQFGANVGAGDDGWWIDDINVDSTLVNPATFIIDPAPNNTLPGCGSNCTTATANVVATPDGVTVNPSSVSLPAPGQVVEFDASTSTANACLSGFLQFRYLRDGVQVRGWSADPMFVTAPDENATFTAQVRCSTALGCVGQRNVPVIVGCPSSGALARFPTILGSKDPSTSEATFAWTPFLSGDPLSWRAVKGLLANVSQFQAGGGFLPNFVNPGTGTSFSDLAMPAADVGFYYLAGRLDSNACNEVSYDEPGVQVPDTIHASWGSGGAGEQLSPGRNAQLPLLPPLP